MGLSPIDAKIRIKSSTFSGTTPEEQISGDHTDGQWTSNMVYDEEFFINLADSRLFIGTNEIPMVTVSGDSATLPYVIVTGTTGGVLPTFGLNTNDSDLSSILGGSGNTISTSTNSFIGGGGSNYISGTSTYSTIGGGYYNSINNGSTYGTIAGGNGCTIEASTYATIGGGSNSIRYASNYSTIAGGNGGSIQYSEYATVGGGRTGNIYNSDFATIAGGRANVIHNSSGSFIGGRGNRIFDSFNSTIGGGNGHEIFSGSSNSTIGGGDDNHIYTGSTYSTIGGGQYNEIISNCTHSTIGGGKDNIIINTSTYSSIIGGNTNEINGATNAHIIGSDITATTANATYINALMNDENGAISRNKTIALPTWDMDTVASISFAHGLSITEIRSLSRTSTIILNDANSEREEIAQVGNGCTVLENTNIVITRTAAGKFDSTDYDSTAFSRGVVVLSYVPD